MNGYKEVRIYLHSHSLFSIDHRFSTTHPVLLRSAIFKSNSWFTYVPSLQKARPSYMARERKALKRL